MNSGGSDNADLWTPNNPCETPKHQIDKPLRFDPNVTPPECPSAPRPKRWRNPIPVSERSTRFGTVSVNFNNCKNDPYIENEFIRRSCKKYRPDIVPPPFKEVPLFSALEPTSEWSAYRYQYDFCWLEVIGRGNSAVVSKSINRLDGCVYAVKCRSFNDRTNEGRYKAHDEVQALAEIAPHENIVTYFTSWEERKRPLVFIQLEYFKHNLRSSETDWASCPERTLLEIIYKISAALHHINGYGYVHLDVTSDNIYIQKDNFKLGGFYRLAYTGETIDAKDLEILDRRYLPAEVWDEGYETDIRVDIFSLGATIYELIRGHETSSLVDVAQLFTQEDGIYLSRFSDQFQKLIRSMMNSIPSRRPTAADILKDPLFKNTEAVNE